MDGPLGLGVTARGFGLRWPRGWALRGADVDAEPGALIAVQGPSGSGRTCLLLALTGRMRPTEGTVTVGGLRLPRQMSALRRVSALAHVPGGALRRLSTGGGLEPVRHACVVLAAFTVAALTPTALSARRRQVWTLDRLHPELTP